MIFSGNAFEIETPTLRDKSSKTHVAHPNQTSLYIGPVEPLAGIDDLTFDHVAFGVNDIDATMPFVSMLQGRFLQGADHLRNQFRWVQFELPGQVKLELLQPIGPESFLHRFLQTRGEGFHHVTFRVPDVERADQQAKESGFETTGLHLDPTWSEVFIRPRTSHGILVQLAQWDSLEPWSGATFEDVLAGRIVDNT